MEHDRSDLMSCDPAFLKGTMWSGDPDGCTVDIDTGAWGHNRRENL